MRTYLILPFVAASLLLAAPQTKSPVSHEAMNSPPVLRLRKPGNASLQPATSLCRIDEQVLFSCKVADGSKLISLCGSRQLVAKTGYVQYRFGKVGALELQFPQKLEDTQAAFRYAHYFRAQVDRTELRFENGAYKYALYDYYEGDVRPEIKAAGVRVTPPGKERGEVEIKCRGRAVSHLGVLSSVVPTAEDSELGPPN